MSESDPTTNGAMIREESPKEQFEREHKRLEKWARRQLARMPERVSMEGAREWVQHLNYRSRLHENGQWISRFLAGELTRRVRLQTEYGSVGEMYRTMAGYFGLNTTDLRYCVGIADAFHGNLILFIRWLRSGGYQKHWYHLVEVTRANCDPTILGPEAFADRILKRLERTAEDMEQVNQELEAKERAEGEEATADDRARVESVQMAVTEEASRMRQKGKSLMMVEEEDTTDQQLEAFEDMLRQMDCQACGRPPEDNPEGHTHPHHEAPSATSMKKYHWLRCALCWKCHQLRHKGHRLFKEETGYDIRELIAQALYFWIEGEIPRFPPGLD